MTALPPATIMDEHRLDEKPEIDQSEDVSRPALYAPEYLNWSLLQTTQQFWRSIMFACMVALGATFDGYAVTVPGNVIANPGFIAQFGTVTSLLTGLLELDALHVSAWTACFTAGQFTGMIGGPLVSDWRGRKFAMIIFAAFLTLAIVLEIVAKEWIVYALGKVFAGIGTGMIQSGLTVYIAEVSPVKIRGALLAMYSVAFGLGQLAGAIGLQTIALDMSYRKVFYSEFVFLGLFLPALLFAPESPWWAVRKGDDNLARRCLSRLYTNVPSFDVEQELACLKSVVNEEARVHPGGTFKQYIECFQGTNLRRTYISFAPLAFQQFVGIGLFFVYTTYFFQLAGYARPFEVSVIQTCIVLACIVLSFLVVDKFGRRPLLLAGGAVMACCSIIVGGLGFKAIVPGTAAAGSTGSALVALACIWSAAYALSAGPLGWTFLADTASSRLRAKTAGLAAAGTCLFGLIFGYTIPIMLSPQQANWGIKIGLLFGGLTVLGLVLIFFTIPETKGRTYAELDELFAAKLSARKFKGYVTAVQLSARSTEDEV